jgi:hypothetical protein
MFLGMILAPTTLYLYWAHPAWTWMYMVNPDSVPGVALLPLVVAHALTLGLAWYGGARLIERGKLKAVGYAAAVGGVLVLVGSVVFWGRLGHYGSYEEYRQGRALDLLDVKLGFVLVAVVIGTLASAAFVAYELSRDSRRVRSR